MKYCPNCASKVIAGNHCPNCGAVEPEDVSVAAGLLAAYMLGSMIAIAAMVVFEWISQ